MAKRKKKLARQREAEPISILGWEFSKAGLAVAISGLVAIVLVVVLLFTVGGAGSWFSSAPKVRAVDVHTAVNMMGYTKVGERLLSSKTVVHKIPGPSQILVTRDNPAGQHIIVVVNLPNTEVDAHFRGMTHGVIMGNESIELQCDGEKLRPLFITEDGDTEGYQLHYAPPQQENRVNRLEDYLGPGKETWNSWTCAGTTKQDGDATRFTGKGGMEVTVESGAGRQDGKEGRAGIGDLVGGRGKAFEEMGLVNSPTAYVRVTWNAGSHGCMASHDIERPNDIARKWEVHCIFPRPKSGKEATLVALGKAQKIKLP